MRNFSRDTKQSSERRFVRICKCYNICKVFVHHGFYLSWVSIVMRSRHDIHSIVHFYEIHIRYRYWNIFEIYPAILCRIFYCCYRIALENRKSERFLLHLLVTLQFFVKCFLALMGSEEYDKMFLSNSGNFVFFL